MQKWEYCVITEVSSGKAGELFRYCNLMTTEGYELLANYYDMPNKERPVALGILIAKLGLEGWEMVGTGHASGNSYSIFFKRPKE